MSSKKDAAFFDAFAAHAEQSVLAAKMLAEMTKRLACRPEETSTIYQDERARLDPAAVDELKSLATKIKAAETAGDTITHDTIKRLRANWITPLDREDIHQLASRMDDVLDYIEEAADRLVLFAVQVAPPEAAELADILVRACIAMAKAVDLLRTMANAPQIIELCVEVNRLENAADAVHRKALAGLFAGRNDPLVVMKWRDIFESLEGAADRCEDVANVVEGVVLEYA